METYVKARYNLLLNSISLLLIFLTANTHAVVTYEDPTGNSTVISSKKIQQFARAIGRIEYADDTHFCTGTLITPKFALTAAHCFYNREGRRIYPHPDGSKQYKIHFPNKNGKLTDGQESPKFTISQIHYHPKIQTSNLQYDVLLLELEQEVPSSEIVPIPPVSPLFYDLVVQENSHPKVSFFGYGYYQLDAHFNEIGPMADELHGIALAITPDSVIKAGLKPYQRPHPENFMAGFEDARVDGARGDSGGPLIFIYEMPDGSVRHFVVGTASKGSLKHKKHQQALLALFGTYVRTANLFDWLVEKTHYQNPFPTAQQIPGTAEYIQSLEEQLAQGRAILPQHQAELEKLEAQVQEHNTITQSPTDFYKKYYLNGDFEKNLVGMATVEADVNELRRNIENENSSLEVLRNELNQNENQAYLHELEESINTMRRELASQEELLGWYQEIIELKLQRVQRLIIIEYNNKRREQNLRELTQQEIQTRLDKVRQEVASKPEYQILPADAGPQSVQNFRQRMDESFSLETSFYIEGL